MHARFCHLYRRYHSHYGTQYADGIKGVFIVSDPTEKADYVESVLQITDW